MGTLDEGDKAMIKVAVLEAFNEHLEQHHVPLQKQINKLSMKISYWAGGLAVVVLVTGFILGAK